MKFTAQLEAIQAGYDWEPCIAFVAPLFEGEDTPSLIADIADASTGEIRGTLSSDDGTLTVLDASTVGVRIPGAMSKDWPAGSIVFDVAWQNADPARLMAFRVTASVQRPVTLNRTTTGGGS